MVTIFFDPIKTSTFSIADYYFCHVRQFFSRVHGLCSANARDDIKKISSITNNTNNNIKNILCHNILQKGPSNGSIWGAETGGS